MVKRCAVLRQDLQPLTGAVATMPALIGSGRSGQASTTTAKSGGALPHSGPRGWSWGGIWSAWYFLTSFCHSGGGVIGSVRRERPKRMLSISTASESNGLGAATGATNAAERIAEFRKPKFRPNVRSTLSGEPARSARLNQSRWLSGLSTCTSKVGATAVSHACGAGSRYT